MKITMTKTNLTKNPNTKTTYLEDKKETKTISERQYKDIVSNDTCKLFRRLGGSEYVEKGYTCYGYRCIQLTSTSPDKQSKTVREFTFESE